MEVCIGLQERARIASDVQPIRRGGCAEAYYEIDITDRKVLEARLLALNETLESRVAERRS